MGIFVPEFKHKLLILFEYAKQNTSLNLPTNQVLLVDELSKIGIQTNASALSRAKSGGKLDETVHKGIISLFPNLTWYCFSYYDPDPLLKRDASPLASKFRQFVFPDLEKITLETKSDQKGRNEPVFPNPELFVFDLQEHPSSAQSYSGFLVIKPARSALIGDEDEFIGELVGHYGFPELTISVDPSGDMKCELKIANGGEEYQTATGTRVRDLGYGKLGSWKVESKVKNGVPAILDENITVASIAIDKMDRSAELFVKAWSLLPVIEIEPNPKLVRERGGKSSDDLIVTIKKMAKRKVEQDFLVDTKNQTVRIGSEYYGRSDESHE